MQKKKTAREIFNVVKPWIFYIGIFLILRYTGIIAAVSVVTQQALLQTGAMDANPEVNPEARKFDYDFSLLDINQKRIDISSLKGKPIFINVWATWCGPCRAEMPSIQNLYNGIDPDKVTFIMLAIDQKEPYSKVNSYIREKEFTFPVYFPDRNLPSQLQVRSIPATFVIDKDGKIVFHESGTANYDTKEFKTFIKGLYQN